MYPLTFDIDYPGKGRNRLSTFIRPILVVLTLPIASVLSVMAPMISLPVLLMLLFRGKYPRWWFDFNVEYLRFASRVQAYALLLRDEYPSTDEEQAVHLNVEYPEDLNRFLPLIKWLLAVPHYLVLVVLVAYALVLTVLAWLLIIVTGSYPAGLFNFVVGVMRWGLRVEAYMLMLAMDEYPPFGLS